MKISVVIPYMESDPGKPECLRRCVQSFSGADEVLVIWNDRMGYAKPVNKGLALARGDFLIVMNDDLVWDGGSLERLCVPNVVTSPRVNGKVQEFWGCAFCIPRSVYDRIGGLDERYRLAYYEDDDYSFTLDAAGIAKTCVPSVDVQHPNPGRTVNVVAAGDPVAEENRARFIAKWGRPPWP